MPHITYDLDPENGGARPLRPEAQAGSQSSRVGHPDHQPEQSHRRRVPVSLLQGLVDLAREFRLFIIADEIYIHMVFEGIDSAHLSEVVGEVPAIVMRGISKELPWPGSRCGWVEILNRDKDANFAEYVDTVIAAKRLEVCSTSGPQLAVPRIFGDPRYPAHLTERARTYAARSEEAYQVLSAVPGIKINRAQGAF